MELREDVGLTGSGGYSGRVKLTRVGAGGSGGAATVGQGYSDRCDGRAPVGMGGIYIDIVTHTTSVSDDCVGHVGAKMFIVSRWGTVFFCIVTMF